MSICTANLVWCSLPDIPPYICRTEEYSRFDARPRPSPPDTSSLRQQLIQGIDEQVSVPGSNFLPRFFYISHSKGLAHQCPTHVRLSPQPQLRLVSSTVHLTGEPDREVKLALSRLLAPAASRLAIDGLVCDSSNRTFRELAPDGSSKSTRRLDGSCRETFRIDRPASILEMSRASLLSGDAELTQSMRGPPSVLAALSPVCVTGIGCVSMTG